MLIYSSPWLIAVSRVLLRLLMPRHSPYALLRLNFLQLIAAVLLNCMSSLQTFFGFSELAAYIPVCSLLPDSLPPPTVSCLGEIVVYPFWKDLKYLYLTSSFCSFSLISFLYSIFNEHKPRYVSISAPDFPLTLPLSGFRRNGILGD